MILILSDDNDLVTNEVVRWLLEFDEPFIRVSENSKILIESLHISEDTMEIVLSIDNGFKRGKINLSEIDSFWYRRSHLRLFENDFKIQGNENESLSFNIRKMLKVEMDTVRDYIFHVLSEKHYLNRYSDNSINKLIFLDLCLKNNLKVPSTFVSSNFSELKTFCDLSGEVVTKALRYGYAHPYRKSKYHPYIMTEKVFIDDFGVDYPSVIFPSQLQVKIDKLFEIRSFFINNNFFSSAIFSQANEKTKIDFRNYDSERPNRVVPYDLPTEIETSLSNVMKQLGINSGSFDIILGTDMEYYILEVNPIGQFKQVSYPCNYNLEKEVAQYLMNYEKREKN